MFVVEKFIPLEVFSVFIAAIMLRITITFEAMRERIFSLYYQFAKLVMQKSLFIEMENARQLTGKIIEIFAL